MERNMVNRRKLHLGCGERYKSPNEGWLNVDKFNDKADVKIDLNDGYWKLDDNSFDEVYCCHLLEHLDDVQNFMDNVWRVCRDKAKVTIVVPHFSSTASVHPFHRQRFNSQSMNHFTAEHWERYGKAVFKVEGIRIHWFPRTDKEYASSSPHRAVASLFGGVVDFFVNWHQHFFERFWCYYVGGAFEVWFELEAVKINGL